jgi:hypothetical protein
LNLQDLLTGKYHQQKILEEEKKNERKKYSAMKRELKMKDVYAKETQYVALSGLFLLLLLRAVLQISLLSEIPSQFAAHIMP